MNCKSPLVSVIIPIYKVEKFMDKCIYSIVEQTYKNLEIILVDDGSPDLSGYKSEQWRARDERIKVIHQKNRGVSAARNKGINSSNGKYLIFVDSDDWMPVDAIDRLVSNAEGSNADLVMGVAMSVGAFKKEYYGSNNGLLVNSSNLSQMLEFTNLIKTQLGPWAKLYKRDLIAQMPLQFPVGIACGEDRIFNWMYLKCCNIIMAIPNTVYVYSQLNLSRACGRYYDNINEWMGVVVQSYSQIFAMNTVNTRNSVLIAAEERFSYCCEHYGSYLSNNSIMYRKKIEETQLIFRNVIKEYLYMNNMTISDLNDVTNNQKQLRWEDDVDSLCSIYSTNSTTSMKLWIKRIIRNVVVRIKQFWIYRLNTKTQC